MGEGSLKDCGCGGLKEDDQAKAGQGLDTHICIRCTNESQ